MCESHGPHPEKPCEAIGVASKQELKDRLIAAVDYFDRDPVFHTWTYKLDRAA
jgi:hypothetical protein